MFSIPGESDNTGAHNKIEKYRFTLSGLVLTILEFHRLFESCLMREWVGSSNNVIYLNTRKSTKKTMKPSKVEVTYENKSSLHKKKRRERKKRVRTLYVTGLPLNCTPRNVHMAFRRFVGYERSVLLTRTSTEGKAEGRIGVVQFRIPEKFSGNNCYFECSHSAKNLKKKLFPDSHLLPQKGSVPKTPGFSPLSLPIFVMQVSVYISCASTFSPYK